jgi:hypothetical protein
MGGRETWQKLADSPRASVDVFWQPRAALDVLAHDAHRV